MAIQNLEILKPIHTKYLHLKFDFMTFSNVSLLGNFGGGGGGGNDIYHPIPILPPAGFVYRKPGLRGGAPIHGFRGKRPQPGPSNSNQSQPQQTSNQVVIVTRSEGIIKEINNVTILKKKTTGLKNKFEKVANIISQEDYDDASNTSTISSPGNLTGQPQTLNRNIKRTVSDNCYPTEMLDEIVVIDSSPDEKQRIMDYDDDNDKSVVGTEVSLSSVAQNMVDVDDVSVIYDSTTGSDFNIVSSPLESEVVEEYPLFPCVADYVDDRHTIDEDKLDVVIESPEDDSKSTIDESDEDGKHKNSESPVYLDEMVNLDTNSEEHFATTEEEIMSMNSEIIIMDSNIKTPEDRLHTTAEDFEAMIDSGNSKDGKESNSSIELMEIENEQELTTVMKPKTMTMSKEQLGERTVITVVVPQATSTNSSTKPQIVSYSRRPITATAGRYLIFTLLIL